MIYVKLQQNKVSHSHLSIGVGTGSTSLIELGELAQSSLDLVSWAWGRSSGN